METITAYFDYLCPFAYRGMEVAEIVSEPLKLEFNWQHYSLYQGNHKADDGWELWNDDLNENAKDGGKGLLPFLASYAAQQQGQDAHNRFRITLMRAYHKDEKPYTLEIIVQSAKDANLDLEAFRSDLNDLNSRKKLKSDHNQAIANQVFATPSFAFKSNLAYFKITELPKTTKEAINLFNDYKTLLERYPYLQNIRRPHTIQKPIK